MATPTKYQRGYSFAGFQASNPNRPLPGGSLDNELENIEQSLTQTINGLNDIRRADGALKNGIVTSEALAADILTGLTPATEWAASVAYTTQDTVFFDGAFYRCLEPHSSSANFADDLAAGLWLRYANIGGIVDDVFEARNETVAARNEVVPLANAAIDAAERLETFDEAYLGEKTTLPVLDNNGNPIANGALVSLVGQVVPADNAMYVRRNGAWFRAVEAATGLFLGYRFVATGGQTVLSGNDANGAALSYIAGAIIVTVNGSVIAPSLYTATNGTSITLSTALTAGDTVVVYSFGTFAVANVYTQAQSDARFTPVAYASRAALIAANPPAIAPFVDVQAPGLPAPMRFRRVLPNVQPTHPYRAQSADGQWWELIGDVAFPQAAGHEPDNASFDLTTLDTNTATTAYKQIFLTDNDWYATTLLPTRRGRTVVGPGASRIRRFDDNARTGTAREIATFASPRAVTQDIMINRRWALPTVTPHCSFEIGTVAVAHDNFTTLSWASARDNINAYRPTQNVAVAFASRGVRGAVLGGFVSFAGGGTGQRSVAIRRNGVPLRQFDYSASPGFRSTVVIPPFYVDVVEGDQFTLDAYQTSGAALNVIDGQFTFEVTYRNPLYLHNRNNRIYQAIWEGAGLGVTGALEQMGSYAAMVERFAEFGVLAFSHVCTIGTVGRPWLGNQPTITTVDPFCGGTTGGVITDTGWPGLRQFWRDVKSVNPNALGFFYISPAIDNPQWTTCGNNLTPTTVANGFTNMIQWADAIFRDPHMQDAGLFLDHFTDTFMTPERRDEVVRRLKERYGCSLMVNITAAGTGPVNYARDCEFLGAGDRLCLEGFFRDGGIDTNVQSQLSLTAMNDLRRRGIRFDAVIERDRTGIPAFPNAYSLNNADLDAQNGLSLFNGFAWPGDTIDYNTPNYGGVHGPLSP